MAGPASSQPYVEVIVQMVLSSTDVYNLANSKSGQTATASNSFDAVMAQQGIDVQSELLGARVSWNPWSHSCNHRASMHAESVNSFVRVAPLWPSCCLLNCRLWGTARQEAAQTVRRPQLLRRPLKPALGAAPQAALGAEVPAALMIRCSFPSSADRSNSNQCSLHASANRGRRLQRVDNHTLLAACRGLVQERQRLRVWCSSSLIFICFYFHKGGSRKASHFSRCKIGPNHPLPS